MKEGTVTPDQVNEIINTKFNEIAAMLEGQRARVTIITRVLMPNGEDIAMSICTTDRIEHVFGDLSDMISKGNVTTSSMKNEPYPFAHASRIDCTNKILDS